jgi:hypothetical protein
MDTLYTVFGPVGRSHSTTSKEAALKTQQQWDEEGYTTRIEEKPYTPIVQDRAYWTSIYPDGNFPHGI